MASSATGGAANGLNILGGVAGLAGNLITSQQGKQDKRISNGQEDPAIAALRKRMAATNAQTAMSVAASQQGVNPALAQRNAQQALAQQQVQTNANLAQGNLQSTLASRAATRGQQHQQIAGTATGLATGLIGMGTSMGAQKAYEASTPGNQAQEGAAGLGSSLASQGAAGLAGPTPSSTPGLMGANEAFGAPSPHLAALQNASPDTRPAFGTATGMPQMQGGQAQPITAAPGLQAGAAPQAMVTQPITEAQMGQPQAAPPPQAGSIPTGPVPNGPSALGQPQMRGGEAQLMTPEASFAPQAAPAPQVMATQAPEPVGLTSAQQVQMLPPETFNDPIQSGMAELLGQFESNGNEQMAEVLRRAILQKASGM